MAAVGGLSDPGAADVPAGSGAGATIRVLLVDDDPLVRSGLELILGGAPEIEVVGQARDGREALDLVASTAPDVVLMDIRMPVLDGIASTRELTSGGREAAAGSAGPVPAVIVLTTFGADEYVVRALGAGARGFLLKDTPPAQIVQAVRTVAAGEAMLSPQALDGLLRHVSESTAEVPEQQRASAGARLALLTERELDVARAVGRGLSNADIARELYLSVPTVKAHVGRVFVKLDVDNRVQVAICVRDAGG
ncbi:DNA-binding response regulator [Marmoricola endophyticus]|uniref:DNA-binding response regulator n=1 Tax=Marmoricola endophyticus TaxID=2040280 RepID=A0A917F9G0_9ACTN|nr:response regulator transcription factor [Marmoricola endophyticus]GGF57620.1 DNA-binding response regulator [Marmoricola endophyticus]